MTTILANFPGLESTPALKSLADPENLKSDVPATQAAAKLKKLEDQEAQTIKSVRYLVSRGCVCSELVDVSKPLVEALENCSESVRFEAARGIAKLAKGESCSECNGRSCCSNEIRKKLAELAYDKDVNGCWKEPSSRVRRMATIAFTACPIAMEEAPSQPEVEDESEPQTVPDREYVPGSGPDSADAQVDAF